MQLKEQEMKRQKLLVCSWHLLIWLIYFLCNLTTKAAIKKTFPSVLKIRNNSTPCLAPFSEAFSSSLPDITAIIWGEPNLIVDQCRWLSANLLWQTPQRARRREDTDLWSQIWQLAPSRGHSLGCQQLWSTHGLLRNAQTHNTHSLMHTRSH